MTRISKRAIWEDLQRAVPEDEILSKHRITRSQLRVVTNILEADGLLIGHIACPSCGHMEPAAFSECPACGIVLEKWHQRKEPKESIWTRILRVLDDAWDAFSCGTYRVVKHWEEKWKARL